MLSKNWNMKNFILKFKLLYPTSLCVRISIHLYSIIKEYLYIVQLHWRIIICSFVKYEIQWIYFNRTSDLLCVWKCLWNIVWIRVKLIALVRYGRFSEWLMLPCLLCMAVNWMEYKVRNIKKNSAIFVVIQIFLSALRECRQEILHAVNTI